MKFTTLLAPLALVGTALADGKAVVAALTKVDETTGKLGDAVTKWKGDIFGTLPIIAESTTLLVQVKKGTKTAEESEALDFDATLAVATATNNLVTSVNTTLSALMDAKPKFDKLLMSPLILVTLGLQKRATTDMSAAIIAKVPAELQELAKGLVAPIDASFEQAIDAFHPF
ncbi:putative antigenic cell wall protein [Chaetomidium leptoderma]|uniref:Antigenic cell wall protein n=1 Tax=Chaetomidium leptoderma TaxID=669021 RepID=A0AAN6VFZ5_9PEZI|nr:putative antigenic cell wall protein [Chaetomidium leptoderma]